MWVFWGEVEVEVVLVGIVQDLYFTDFSVFFVVFFRAELYRNYRVTPFTLWGVSGFGGVSVQLRLRSHSVRCDIGPGLLRGGRLGTLRCVLIVAAGRTRCRFKGRRRWALLAIGWNVANSVDWPADVTCSSTNSSFILKYK